MATVRLRTRGNIGSPLMIKDNIFIFVNTRVGTTHKVLLYDLTSKIEVGIVEGVRDTKEFLQKGYSGTIRVLSEVDVVYNDNKFNISNVLSIIDSSLLNYILSSEEITEIIAYESEM